MQLSTCCRVALKALERNRLQTGLTMLGMTVGVGAVLTTVALGNGAQISIEDQIRAAGLNVVIITAGNYRKGTDDAGGGVVDHQADAGNVERPPAGGPWRGDVVPAAFHPEDDPMEKHDHPTARQRLGDAMAGLGAAATLTRDDAERIRRDIAGVQHVASGVHENARVVAGDRRWFTRLHGTEIDLPLIRRAWTFPHGRFFSRREQDRAAQVVVLGSVVRDRLYGHGTNPVGREVRIWNQPFDVVGVVGSKSWVVRPSAGDDQLDAVYVPVTTVQRLLNLSKLNTISITVESSGDVTRVAREIAEVLRYHHNIGWGEPDDFTVRTQARDAVTAGGIHPTIARALAGNVANLEKVTLEQIARTLERASRTMTALLASIAGVSLLVGGIGIMNIMLLSVTERTREIGIRRAVGAKARDVLRQALAEAMAISLVGGTAGVGVGLIAAAALAYFLRWAVVVTPGAIALAFGIAAGVGVFFGLYPARLAARVDPIEALRYE
jgi:putative ABC transport system permease protein